MDGNVLQPMRAKAQEMVVNGRTCLVADTRGSAEIVLRQFAYMYATWGPQVLRNFSYALETRPDGRREVDDGFIDLTDHASGMAGKDRKQVFHYQPLLCERVWREPIIQENKALGSDMSLFLRLCDRLYHEHMATAFDLLAEIDRLGYFERSMRKALGEALEQPIETSRSVLRVLRYPGHEGDERAKVHFDRSMLTLHGGDRGGTLFARLPTGEVVDVSPSKREVLAFWGAKAEMLTRGESPTLQALAHGARATQGEMRTAVVSFWHVNEVLWDAPKVPY